MPAKKEKEFVMRIYKMLFLSLILAIFMAGCGDNGKEGVSTDTSAPTNASTSTDTSAPTNASTSADTSAPTNASTSADTSAPANASTSADTSAPTVSFTVPIDAETNVAINRTISATFSEAMDPLTTTTFRVTGPGTMSVTGTVDYNLVSNVATFTPEMNLAPSTTFTATITTGAQDLAGNMLISAYVWSFTTGATVAAGPAPVLLGTAGNFAILAKSGISTVPGSAVTGDIGVSPIDQTAITGFSETMDASNTFSTSTQVVGKIYAADYTPPTPTYMTTAVSDMEIAYTDAAGRTLPNATELGAGEIGGLTIIPGLYKWGTGVLISTDVTLSGGPNDVWIFQIAQDLVVANGKQVILAGGAQAKNIFWQAFGAVNIGTTAHFEGVVLSQTAINLATGASANSRLLAQTAVTLQQNAVTQPSQ